MPTYTILVFFYTLIGRISLTGFNMYYLISWYWRFWGPPRIYVHSLSVMCSRRKKTPAESNGHTPVVVMCDIPSATSAFCAPFLGNYLYDRSPHHNLSSLDQSVTGCK